MNENDLSIVITTLKSEEKIYQCLDSLKGNIKVLVIENSNNENFKNSIEANYTNVKCFLTGANKGYSVANNLGLSKVDTKYALVLNPDTIVEKKALNNFLITATKNQDFWLIGPGNNQSKNIKNNEITEVNNLKGFAIFFNMKKFNNNFFDENFFLYFEEIDLCRQVKINGGKILLDPSIAIKHDGASSVNKNFQVELEKNRNWHWMWSTFYYHKKYKGYLIALLIIFPKLVSSFLKTILYFIIFDKIKKNIYLHRLNGLVNSILGKKSWYRPRLD